jgi:hypothetical protein
LLIVLLQEEPCPATSAGYRARGHCLSFDGEQFVEAIGVLDLLDQEVEDFFLLDAIDQRLVSHIQLLSIAWDGAQVTAETPFPDWPFIGGLQAVEMLRLQW